MPKIPVTVQTFSNIYIGDSSSSSTLTRVSDLRTRGVGIAEDKPTTYVKSLGRRVQSGNHIVRITLVFLSDSDMVTKISRGIRIQDNPEDPMGEAVYSLFLLSPDPSAKNSYYFPEVQVVSTFELQYGKDQATSTAVILQAEEREITEDIIFKDTSDALDIIMGTKSPI